MALSDKQRVAFFRLARRAFDNQQPDQPFDPWRKHEMREAGLKDSISKVSKIIGFDTLMRHFAELAYDMDLVAHYQSNEIRMLQRLIDGLLEDKAYILNFIGKPETFEIEYTISNVNNIRLVMQKLGDEVSELCAEHNIKPGHLPTAGAPYFFRGKRAAAFAELLHRHDRS